MGRAVALFYFHGTPSSRVEWQMFGSEARAKRLHLRVIAIDRPSMGLSDFQPGRHISDWPAYVVALADGLASTVLPSWAILVVADHRNSTADVLARLDLTISPLLQPEYAG